ncbi:MAG: hypothetical protein MJ120_05755 [Clostridia bacterium]|nr:hypothetical protein [Clostridia bacterium]
MKRFFKIFLSIILCFSFIFLTNSVCFASAKKEKTASLFNIYSSGMLFQQKKIATVGGYGKIGEKITLILTGENGNRLKTESEVNRNSQFSISFRAPDGGYKKYTITLLQGGEEFARLEDIVFGEMWLAGGQSNMAYSFKLSSTYEQNSERSEWLRFLFIDKYPTFVGDKDRYPLNCMEDFEDGCCKWYKGTDDMGEVSAVAFYFAQKLEKELKMPVGILCPSFGGSALLTWLSRNTIDSNPQFSDYLKEHGNYVEAEEWRKSEINPHSTITANYNKKVYPLRSFAIAGMIWYQGEEEIYKDWEIGYYTMGLELLQESYGRLFGFENKKMPFIATQVAPYAYGNLKMTLHNNEFVEFQKADPESRSVVTIYDIKSDWRSGYGALHPANKQPVGERFAKCAMGLAYGRGCTSAATVSGFKADGDDFYVTFSNVGDGLLIDGKKAIGFSLAEKGGIYVQADAEIVSSDTIKIHSNEVENPASAAYALAENNTEDNVYSTQNGKKFLPIAPFTTDIENDALYWEEPAWADCDSNKAYFLSYYDDFTGYHKTWSGKNAKVKVEKDKPYSGKGSLKVVSDKAKKTFTVSPVMTFKMGDETKFYDRMMRNWSHYSTITVMMKNNGKKSVKLESLKIYTADSFYTPEVNGKGKSTSIPADCKWHKLTFNLDTIYKQGETDGSVYSRKELGSITDVKFCFKNAKKSGSDINIDDIRFTASADEGRGKVSRAQIQREEAQAFFEEISGFLINLAKNLFKGK